MLGPGAEFDLILRLLARAGGELPREIMIGPGDDAAVLMAHPVAVSCDLSIEGVHFRRDWLSAEEIGWRATSAALSDLAAMAARPVGILLSLAASGTDASGFTERVVHGAIAAARAVDALLVGGDLTRSPGPLVLDVVVLGEAAHPLRRGGARAGDELWVTGRLGAPARAVRDWLAGGEPEPAARERYAHPIARTREALWLRQRADLTAAIDLSDGLAGDLPHLAAASRVGIEIDRGAVPAHDAVADSPELALTGGEEYELCFAAPPGAVQRVAAEFEVRFDLPLTRIGDIVAPPEAMDERGGDGVRIRNPDGSREPLPPPEYQHFTEER